MKLETVVAIAGAIALVLLLKDKVPTLPTSILKDGKFLPFNPATQYAGNWT